MGLDIWFYKRKFNRHDPNEPVGKDEEGNDTYERMEEIAYYRKVNFLMSFFNYDEKCEDYGDGCCHYIEVYDNEIDALIDACEKTLKTAKKYKGKEDYRLDPDEVPLTPQEGFFYGSTELDEYFVESVEEVLDDFKEIRENLKDDEQTFMYAWW